MPQGAVVLELHVLDHRITTGVWCPCCSLPSAVRVPWVAVDPSTLRVAMRGAVVACQDCGCHWPDV